MRDARNERERHQSDERLTLTVEDLGALVRRRTTERVAAHFAAIGAAAKSAESFADHEAQNPDRGATAGRTDGPVESSANPPSTHGSTGQAGTLASPGRTER